jgi:methionine sulfoxide reductase heme-binding subunit
MNASLATAVAPHLFWIASRAAGIAALILSSATVCVGLSIGLRLRLARALDMRASHEALSLATLGALVVHGLALLGDGYLKPSLFDVAVPFLSSHESFWTTTGGLVVFDDGSHRFVEADARPLAGDARA